MSYAVGTRTEILGILTCTSPLHVGGWDSTADADLAIARDGTGRPCIPGTSLAGALRAYLAGTDAFRPYGPAVLADLFGHVVPGSRIKGSPSRLRIDDAHLLGDPAVQVRDGVGIDRRSGSAAAGFLYTRQVLPAGTRFAFRMLADTPTAASSTAYPGGWAALIRDAVDAVVAGLTHTRVPLGANRGRGHGRTSLGEITVRTTDLSEPAGLIAWLTGTIPPAGAAPAAAPADGQLHVTVTWQPANPLLVRDSVAGTVVDTIPLTDTHADGNVRLLLPGSSIRGAIRAHAERIMRTLTRQDAPADLGDALLQPPAGVDVLFGAAPTSRDHDPVTAHSGRRGAVAVDDCHSTGHVTTSQWTDVVTTRPAHVPAAANRAEEGDARGQRNVERDAARTVLRDRLQQLNEQFTLTVSDHVAIDRWTGGAGDHRLFSALDPAATVTWEPIRIRIDLARLHRAADRQPHSAVLALPLLLLLLRDLRDGWLTLGYGGTRGRGHLTVTGVTFDGAGLPAGWQHLTGRTLDDVLTDPPPEVTDAMTRWAHTFDRPDERGAAA
ncbi:RAMP superfamily CRISPR-associated protein [Dactylosporangium sp. NPDC005555]|uniref:RAMP superfamily CRISPR-associated protein n=1 Tax=Dactylosporangium sp. NPDC005555 TaxID=3154889 RepID=UPI0033B6EF84